MSARMNNSAGLWLEENKSFTKDNLFSTFKK